jgi:iron-sulfur cluster assembly protein/iron-sulfur cluster insertion protein
MSTTETPTETQTASPITLTDSAVAKVAELLAQEGNDQLALRVAVRPGGCSGFSYEMFFDSDIADDDLQGAYAGAAGTVKVVVDPSSAQLLTGATLDFSDGLQGAGFAINNPNATRSCGCGQSFS